MSGYNEIDGHYVRQADMFNSDVYYLRVKPTPMYAYRNNMEPGINKWYFDNQLGRSKVSS